MISKLKQSFVLLVGSRANLYHNDEFNCDDVTSKDLRFCGFDNCILIRRCNGPRHLFSRLFVGVQHKISLFLCNVLIYVKRALNFSC